MTPNIAVLSNPDEELVRKTAALLLRKKPNKNPERIVQELLKRLQSIKLRRELLGLNHWEDYAPRYLHRVIRRNDARVLRSIVEFMTTRNDEALRFAYRITQDWSLAQRALDQTYDELLAGRTRLDVFFHALKLNARNVLSLRATERVRFQSLDTLPVRSGGDRSGVSEEGSAEMEPMDFASHRRDDQDPLDILIQREDDQARIAEFDLAMQKAETERDHWWIRQKNWGKELGIGTGGTARLSTK